MSLHVKERNRIVLEERYRLEVRTALSPSVSGIERALRFLERPFILWFLSSVAISGITSGYTWYANRLERATRESERVVRIGVELDYRLEGFLGRWLTRFKQDQNLEWRGALSPLQDPLVVGGFGGPPGIIDFSNQTFRTLLIEFSFMCSDPTIDQLVSNLHSLEQLHEATKSREEIADEASRVGNSMRTEVRRLTTSCSGRR